MYYTPTATAHNTYVSLAHEHATIYGFADLETPQYSSRVLRDWSAQWVPSYVWSPEGISADPIDVSLFQKLIVIPNSYTLFQVVNGSCLPIQSYSSFASQEYHRRHYPSIHSLQVDSAKASQYEHATVTSDGTFNFILLWHDDHSNYWHFNFDIAFRLFYFVTLFPRLIPRLNLVVVGTNSISSFQYALLAAILGTTPNLIFSTESSLVEAAIFIPPVQTLLARKDWLAAYSRTLCSRLSLGISSCAYGEAFGINNGPHLQRRLYIQRGKSKNPRELLNESEVISTLQDKSFFVCDPGSLSLDQQAHLFHSADLVVGPHGSAFANILYMKPSSRVIEFTNSTYDPFHDFFLARQLDVSFTRIRQNDLGLHAGVITPSHQPFSIDIGKVKRAVTVSLAQPSLTTH